MKVFKFILNLSLSLMHNLVVLFYTIDVVNVTLISFVHTCVATKTIETTPTERGGGGELQMDFWN